MPDPRPSVFIGSSAEGLPVAEAIQVNLDHSCEIVIWSQGVFGLSDGTLEALVTRLPVFDFAILVLTPDDMITSREREQQAPRDNVLLELGLCIGALGRERTFTVYDRTSDIKIPSDLAGVTSASYQPHSDGNLQSTLGAACTQIKGSIQQHGIRAKDDSNTFVIQNTHFQIIHDLLDDSAEQFIILMYEQHVTLNRETIFGGGLRYNLGTRTTRSNGTFSVDQMCRKLADADLLTQNLRQQVTLTPRGNEFATWLVERGHKAIYFDSDIGQWGTIPADIEEYRQQLLANQQSESKET